MWKVVALCFIKDSRRTAFFVLFFLIYSAVCIFFTCAAYQLSCSRVAHCSPVTSWHPTEIGQARPVEGEQVCWSASPDTTRWTHCSTPLLPFSLALLWEAPPSLSSISKQLHSCKLIALCVVKCLLEAMIHLTLKPQGLCSVKWACPNEA